jgi:predicted  nucleic acid-binding Zn-ribbon protein
LTEVRSQLETEKTRSEDAWEELEDREKTCDELRSELSDLKQKSATARELPDAAEVYNQFKARNPKTKTTYSDVEKILAMIEES